MHQNNLVRWQVAFGFQMQFQDYDGAGDGKAGDQHHKQIGFHSGKAMVE
jgi:hypothetical protein